MPPNRAAQPTPEESEIDMCHLCDAKRSGVEPGMILVNDEKGLADLFGALAAKGAPVSAEERATAEMDRQVETILADLNTRMAAIREQKPGLLVGSASVYALTEGFAADLMFRQPQSAIAWTTAILAHRYLALLDQWADLFVHENGSDTEGVEGLLPEQEAAVAGNPRTPQPEHKTGQYL